MFPSRLSGGELVWRGLRGAVVLCRALLPAGEFFCFLAFSLQAGAFLRGPLPVLKFLLLADAFLGGEFFQLAGEFFGRAFLFLASPLLGRALLLYEFLCGALPFLLGGALAPHGALALGRALLLGRAPALLASETFLHLASALLDGLFLGGAFLLEPGSFLLEPGSLFGGAFLFPAGSFLGGAFLFLAGSLLGGAFLFLAGLLLPLRGVLALGDTRLPSGGLMLRAALLLLSGGVPLLVGQAWLYCAVRRCNASRRGGGVVDFWTGNGP